MEFLKLSRVKLLNIVLLCLALNACSLLDPFIDRRREAGAKDEAHLYVGASRPDAPAICYNKWTTDFETLQKWPTKNAANRKPAPVPSKQKKHC